MRLRAFAICVPVAILWARQVRLERLLVARQAALEADTRYFAKSINETIEYGVKSWNRWGDELVKKINREFSL